MFAQKLIVSYLTKIFIQFFSILTTLFVARIVGPEVLGTVAFGLAYAGMFKMISELGVGTTHMKLLSEGRDVNKCMGTYIRIKAILIGAFFLVATGTYFIPKILTSNYQLQEQDYVVLLSIIVITIEHFWTIPRVTFAAYTHQAKQDIPDTIYQVLYQIIRLCIVIIGFKAIAIVCTNLISAIIVSFAYWYLFKTYPLGKYDKDLSKEYMGTSIIIIVMLIGQSVVNLTDIVLIKYFSNTEQVGYYSAGIRLSGFVKLIGQSVGLLFFPLFSKSLANNNFEYINRSIAKYERFTMLFIFPSILFVAFHSDIIVRIFLGEKFSASSPILSISFISCFVYVLSITYGNILSGNGSFSLLAKIYIATAIVFMSIVFSVHKLIPEYSTSILVSISILITNISIGFLFIFFAGKNFEQITILPSKYIILSFIPLIFIWYIGIHYIEGIVFPILYSLALLSIFYMVIAKAKILLPEDWRMLKELIDIKKALSYVKRELKSTRDNSNA